MRVDASAFWKWAYSDFLSNAQRGVLAEYLVALAVNSTAKARVEWDACDITTTGGLRIEVKSAAYVQAWMQQRPSVIRFDIAPKKAWDQASNTYSPTAVRGAQLYVFSVFETRDRGAADPLDTNQWYFLVCPTDRLEKQFGSQRSVALSSLESLGLKRLTYGELSRVVAEYEA